MSKRILDQQTIEFAQKCVAEGKGLKAIADEINQVNKDVNPQWEGPITWQFLRSALLQAEIKGPLPPPMPVIEHHQKETEQAPVTRHPSPVTGILILALGHPYYGQMAANLAASIKFHDKNVKITVAYHGRALHHLTPDKLKLFDTLRLVPDAYVTKAGKVAYFKAKTFLYNLSPYDNTLYLDADMLWMRKDIGNVFKELSSLDFTITNRGSVELAKTNGAKSYQWANVGDIKKGHNLRGGKLYNLHSELIWFKKCDKMKVFFETVQQIYDEPKVKSVAFAGDIADELAFAIAMIKCGVKPHAVPFSPGYWYLLDAKKGTTIAYIQKNNYWFFSAGGNAGNEFVRNRYNILSRAYARETGIIHPWKLQPKRSWLPERRTL